MNILITGANGQLGREIRELTPKYTKFRFLFTDLPEIDLTRKQSVDELVDRGRPDCIINCAAYTAVDKAETDVDVARSMNRDAVRYLALAASRHDALLIHISTDYVFNGKASKPYCEDDTTAPDSVYGMTKLEGEGEVFKNSTKAVIIRTSWLYSPWGSNFVLTMLRLGRSGKEVNVVTDQTGSPTYARDLAKAILDIIPLCTDIKGIELLHYADQGVTNWNEFARSIFEIAGLECRVNPILSIDFPTAARRPQYSVLDTSKIRLKYSIEIPYWKDSLRECLKRIDTSV